MRTLKVLLMLLFVVAPLNARTTALVDDFNDGKPMNKIGIGTGCWNVNPSDTNQFCKASFDSVNKIGDSGYSLRIDYDLDTPQTYIKEYPNTALSGYFTPIRDMNISKLKLLVLSIKGDKEKGYTRAVTIELKNKRQAGSFVLEGITDQWQQFSIPLWKFNLDDLSSMNELLINFNEKVTRKTGTLYIDDIYFSTDEAEHEAVAARVPAGVKIEIDGDLSEWEKNKKVKPMRYDPADNLEFGKITDKKDFDATVEFQWDEKYLYFAAWVRDDNIMCRFRGPEIYKDDGIELFIDPKNDSLLWGSSSDFQIGFAPISPDSDEPQCWSWFQNMDPGDNVELGSLVVKKRKWEGYQIEAAVKWTYLGITPRKGMLISVSPALNDFDGDPESSGKLNWSFTKEADEKFKLGKMLLAD